MSNIFDYMGGGYMGGGDYGPYGYENQQTNPFSQFQNSALPWPATYAGWPTDASGNPIKPPPGMTLNTTPTATAAPAAAPAAPTAPSGGSLGTPSAPNMAAYAPGGAYANATNAAMAMAAAMNGGSLYGPDTGHFGGTPGQGNQATTVNYHNLVGPLMASQGAAAPAAPAAAPAPAANPSGLTSQQYLQLRANPGYIATPGATVPQAGTGYQPTSGNGVLQQFLQSWRPAKSGPGSGYTQSLAKNLRNLSGGS